MSEQLKLRGDTATNLASFTPAQRECVVDITNNRLCVGDGSTANGWPLAKLSEGAWTVSTGIMQCVLSQRTAITSEPVPTLRPTTANTAIALDIMPNGSPGGTGIAWHDICDADVLNNTSTPEALAKRLRVAGCIYTTMRSQVALGGVTDLVGDLWVEFSAGAAFPSALGP